MSMPFEHDYIGLSEAPAMESPEKMSSSSSSTLTEEEGGGMGGGLKYKETELRLGLPGSESPERKVEKAAVEKAAVVKSFMLGAKRGFSDAIDGPGKWVLSAGGGGSGEVEVGKGGVLFSPRGGKGSAGVEVTVPQPEQVAPAGRDAGSLAAKAKTAHEKKPQIAAAGYDHGAAPASKAQVVGWPPIRSFRKNTMASCSKNNEGADSKYVKVSMDGAPYLRKVDLKNYGNYKDLSSALEKMFTCFTIGQYGSHGVAGHDGLNENRLMDLLHGSEYVLTYEDKDEDWMLVGDVPWEMFTDSCKRLRIMKSTEAIGLAPRAMEKCKNRN